RRDERKKGDKTRWAPGEQTWPNAIASSSRTDNRRAVDRMVGYRTGRFDCPGRPRASQESARETFRTPTPIWLPLAAPGRRYSQRHPRATRYNLLPSLRTKEY